MTMNDQDARALTYLARRLRTETHGAREWDEAGTFTYVAKLIGSNLPLAVERITRHAGDKEARTPAAIDRPFVPDAQQPSSRPEPIANHERCAVCYQPQARCERVRFADDDHEFRPATDDLKRTPDAMAAIVTDAKGRLEQTRETPEPPPVVHDPRAELAAATKHGRKYVGIDLSADYLDLSLRTRFAQPGLDLSGGVA